MKIVIAGLGETGFGVARTLLKEENDLILIERDQDEYQRAKENLDAEIIHGDASDAMTLEPLIDDSVDLYVAATNSDSSNIISTLIAIKFGAKHAITRIGKPNNLIHPLLTDEPEVSILNAEMIVSKDLTRLIGNPSADEIDLFAKGKVEMLRLDVADNAPVANKRLRDVNTPSSWLVVASVNGGKFSIASGDTILKPGDQVFVVGNPKKQKEIEDLLGLHPAKVHRVVIIGYNEISAKLAYTLKARNIEVRLIEQSKVLAEKAAEDIDGVLVFQGDGTSEEILDQAGSDQADYLVALTNDDESNVLISLLAKEKGVKRVITLTQKPQYKPIIEKIGIDAVVNPRSALVDEIVRSIHRQDISGISTLEGGEGRMMEFIVKDRTKIADQPLHKIRLPKKTLIGAIVRGDELIIPHGDSRIKKGDHVIVFSASSVLSEVKKLFASV